MKKVDYSETYKLIQPLVNTNIKGSSRLARIISKLFIPKPEKNGVVIKTIYDFELLVDPVKDIGVERSLYYLGTYEQGTLHIIKNILTGGNTFVDVGANIGLMSVFASQIVGKSGRVISFEANPDTKKILEYNLSLNNIGNVTTSGFALGSENGEGKIYTNLHINRGSASLLKSENSGENYPVKIIRLDQFKEIDLSEIHLMKIDIEGYELEALKGSEEILKRINAPMLIIECSKERENYNGSADEIYHYLKKLNSYRFFKLKKSKEKISELIEIKTAGELPSHSNIFCFLEKQIAELPGSIFGK